MVYVFMYSSVVKQKRNAVDKNVICKSVSFKNSIKKNKFILIEKFN